MCGSNIRNSETNRLLKETGIFHVFVVSAGHLILLIWLTQKLPSSVRWLFLVFYCCLAGFQPPVVRGLMAEAVIAFDKHFKWGSAGTRIHLYSCLLPLALFPNWIHSWSYFLSCWAATALSLTGRRNNSSPVFRSLMTQALIACGFGVFSIKIWAGNFIFGPIVSLLAFPLATMATLCHLATPIVDMFFFLLLSSLTHFKQLISEPTPNPEFDHLQLMWLLFALFLTGEQHIVKTRWKGQHV